VLATTATANDRVVADVAEQLGAGVAVFRGPLARASLRLEAIALADQAERLAWLAEHLPDLPGSGIVYCLTIADTQRVAAWLRSRGINARAYNAELTTPEREALEDALIAGEVKALVATVALGMGFDKPDLGFVVHYQRPGSAIAYYQQVGRAGRGVERAHGILLSGREDDDIADFFIRNAFPPTMNMHKILAALEGRPSMTIGGLQREVNLPYGKIEQALKLLEIDGAVARDRGRFSRTALPWEQDEERIARVIATRRDELAQMQAYVTHRGCRMEFLTRLLDDPAAGPCGQCDNDRGVVALGVDADLVVEARTFFRRDLRPIAPRKRWMSEAGETPSGTINPPNEPGLALSVLGDAGWGRLVAAGRADGAFDGALVAASARAITGHWRPNPAPAWVTVLPSRAGGGAGEGIGAFARALASELGLRFVPCFSAAGNVPPQDEMLNSVQQLRNALAKLSVTGQAVRPGPVLLVDDLVDSGWTMTVAGWLLRGAGSGPVLPFALAVASGRDG
jgi:ATP-dependent DNA helicase RecQ